MFLKVEIQNLGKKFSKGKREDYLKKQIDKWVSLKKSCEDLGESLTPIKFDATIAQKGIKNFNFEQSEPYLKELLDATVNYNKHEERYNLKRIYIERQKRIKELNIRLSWHKSSMRL